MIDGDRSNLPSSGSSHRLPTISASQALQKLKETGGKWLSSGLPHLDHELRGSNHGLSPSQILPAGGYTKGQITEIYGPPGSGKTGLALHAATTALQQGSHIVWIDAGNSLHGSRLSPLEHDNPDHLPKFHHYTVPTLSHLLSLICHPPPSFPPHGTSLLVIDNASTLFTSTYPDNPADSTRSKKLSPDAQWAANRRYAVIADFLSKLTKLAAVNDLAVLLISQCGIKVRTEFGPAILRPAIWTKSWSEGVQSRIVVFRDFWRDSKGERVRGVRFVGVVKRDGVSRHRLDRIVPFLIDSNGCRQLDTEDVKPLPTLVAVPHRSPAKKKRKREEIADSQSDDSEGEFLDPIDRAAGETGENEAARLDDSFAVAAGYDAADLAEFEEAMGEDPDEI